TSPDDAPYHWCHVTNRRPCASRFQRRPIDRRNNAACWANRQAYGAAMLRGRKVRYDGGPETPLKGVGVRAVFTLLDHAKTALTPAHSFPVTRAQKLIALVCVVEGGRLGPPSRPARRSLLPWS